MAFSTGTLIGGRYKPISVIAKGGMGELWLAQDTNQPRMVAIKVLKEENLGDDDMLARLRIEAENNSKLHHKNIVTVYGYYERGRINPATHNKVRHGYIVMEYINGTSLDNVLKNTPRLPIRDVYSITEQIARGLAVAHSKGVIHRDVKPANILLLDDGVIKITDFGVSFAEGQQNLTNAGMVIGTAQYISPEQALGNPASFASDIYSLGVMTYEMIAGIRPFSGKTPVDVAVSHVSKKPEPFPSILSVNPDVERFVFRMLEKKAADRPKTANEVADFFCNAKLSLKPVRGIKSVGSASASASSAGSAGGAAGAGGGVGAARMSAAVRGSAGSVSSTGTVHATRAAATARGTQGTATLPHTADAARTTAIARGARGTATARGARGDTTRGTANNMSTREQRIRHKPTKHGAHSGYMTAIKKTELEDDLNNVKNSKLVYRIFFGFVVLLVILIITLLIILLFNIFTNVGDTNGMEQYAKAIGKSI
jgi:serine/threonine-protein kinase